MSEEDAGKKIWFRCPFCKETVQVDPDNFVHDCDDDKRVYYMVDGYMVPYVASLTLKRVQP
jgi:hypothetical protein